MVILKRMTLSCSGAVDLAYRSSASYEIAVIESLNAIRSLGLAPIFEDLYFGKANSASLLFMLKYPSKFHDLRLEECQPLTSGGLIPLFSDDDFYDIYLYDPVRHKVVVKFLEEPDTIDREFDNWQQFLAYKLLELSETGPTDDELRAVAEVAGFRHTSELFSMFERMKQLSGIDAQQLEEDFIRACS
jgi:hypothetical protein